MMDDESMSLRIVETIVFLQAQGPSSRLKALNIMLTKLPVIVKLQCLRRFVSSSKRLRVQGEPVCRNKTVAVVREVPEETCDLEPATVCRTANKLVPHLQPQQQCADQPRQATPARPYRGSDIDVYIDIRNICCLLPLSYSRFYKDTYYKWVLKQCI